MMVPYSPGHLHISHQPELFFCPTFGGEFALNNIFFQFKRRILRLLNLRRFLCTGRIYHRFRAIEESIETSEGKNRLEIDQPLRQL